ncbi:MAG: hypothetical protein KGD73_05665 [Candidatus Lokiarchaeota archaeon]|nr:hypothetical protein [Candidatus Lokiarchaeota archaeon]
MDQKYETLVEKCIMTGNHSKLSATTLHLISNHADLMGIKLGIGRRNPRKEEFIHYFLERINRYIVHLGINLIPADMIKRVKIVETLFSKSKGNLPKTYLKDAIALYYDIRKIQIPEMDRFTRALRRHDYSNTRSFNLFSKKPRNGPSSTMVRDLLMTEIEKRERELRYQFQNSKGMNEQVLETSLQLKNIKSALNYNDSRKIPIQGRLKDNANYHASKKGRGWLIVLAFIILLGVSEAILIAETILLPSSLEGVGGLMVFFLISILLLGYLYYNNVKKIWR